MAKFGPNDPTLQVTTGNFRTTMDLFDATKLNNGAVNSLGSAYFDSPSTLANPNGAPTKYRYVRYNSAANTIAVQANPVAVYWTDFTFTTVSMKVSESWGVQSGFAGILMPNSTDFAGLTAAKLNGNFVWIAVAGVVAGVVSSAAGAGAQLFATADASATGGFTTATSAAATLGRISAFALAASPSSIYVNAESI